MKKGSYFVWEPATTCFAFSKVWEVCRKDDEAIDETKCQINGNFEDGICAQFVPFDDTFFARIIASIILLIKVTIATVPLAISVDYLRII